MRRCTPFRSLPWPAKANAIGLCAAAAAFSALLWPAWRQDDNLAHGLFLPFLAGILVFESRRDPSPRFLRPGPVPLAACALLTLLSLASLASAVIYAAALGWTHAMAEFLLATALVPALGAAWLAFADQRVRFIPLNWAAAAAVLLWLFASPPPPGAYARLSLLLQGQVTGAVVRILNAAGIAAYRDGNVIELARTSVGVSEACSGARSLISCAAAGLFLSALLVRRRRNRVLLLVLSPLIGLAMNLLRSLLLTLLANAGVDIVGRWHDLTGASILAGTTLLVAALAILLHRGEAAAAPGPAGDPPAAAGRSLLQGMVAAALLLAAAAFGLLAAARPARAPSGPAPNLEALLPPPPPGWTARTVPNLESDSEILRTRALLEREYSAAPAQGGARLTLYVAYWRPGQAPVSLVDAHTPDACWPGTGWEPRPVPDGRPALGVGGRTLAPAECRLFAHNNLVTHVWYWHLYGGRPLAIVDPYSVARLLKLSWRRGLANPGDQLFVSVSSNRPWEEIASEPTVRQFFENLKALGL
ncbi:MAG TPA: exosortase/archaeosortase family protein [Opitutaceae bacterium]|nr:exosortase/archaeosortase family protein [Opitutaceae bacterium]